MASWDDVRRAALDMPDAVEVGEGDRPRSWRIRRKAFVWERPLRRADLDALGESAPTGPILGVRLPQDELKKVLIADSPEVYFTTPHFDGYPAILVQLDHIDVGELEELVIDAWIECAPKRLSAAFLADKDQPA